MPRIGTGRVYLRGETYWIDYSIRGKRYRESTGETDERKAQRKLNKRLGQAETGTFIGPTEEKVRLADLVTMLKNHYRIEELRTWDRAELSVAHLEAFFDPDARAVDITADRLDSYVLHRQDEGAAQATIKRELAALSKMFALAIEKERLSKRPSFPNVRVRNERTGFLAGAELEAVIAELTPHVRPVVRFAALTGWRFGEIIGLTWAQVDWDAGQIRLYTSKNDEGRSFPFDVLPPLAELLEEQQALTRGLERERGMVIPWVFHRDGNEIKSIRTGWKAACRRAGVPTAIVHDLRRTAVRKLIRAGVPEKIAMTLIGHKTRSIFDRYNIVDDQDQRDAIQKLAERHAARTAEPRTMVPIREQA